MVCGNCWPFIFLKSQLY